MADTTIRLGDTVIHNVDDATLCFINEWNDNNDYVVAHTSGSTGKPKPIKLPKSDMALSAKATCEFFGINKSSNLVLPLSSQYIAGKMMIVRAIVSGATLWIESPSNKPLNIDYGLIDLLPVVPSQVEHILELPICKNIRNLIVGGGAIHNSLENHIIESGINAYATYGMTETCSHVALRKIGNKEYVSLPGVSFDKDPRDCLVIKTEKYSFKSIVTNDVVNLIDSNRFVWVARYDNVINTGGIKIYPETIEQKLSAIIDAPFYVIGKNDVKWGNSVVLYIEDESCDIDTIRLSASRMLDKYSMPKEIILVRHFERTASGKIVRKIL